MVAGVIFDIGGVLAPDIWESVLPARDRAGGIAARFSLDKEQVHRVGGLLWEAFAYTPETPLRGWRELERQYWEMFIRFFWEKAPPPGATVEAFIALSEEAIRPVHPELECLLQNLQAAGLRLGICSNNNEFWFRRQMDRLGLHRFFPPAAVVLSSRVGVGKSAPRFEMFHAAVQALGLPPAHCIYIDDRPGNVERARRCGLSAIHFTADMPVPRLTRALAEHGLTGLPHGAEEFPAP